MWLAERMCIMAARTQGLIADFLIVFLVRWALKGFGLGYFRLDQVLAADSAPFEPAGIWQTLLLDSIYFASGFPELFLGCIWAVYAVVFLAAFGQTPGMKWVGIKLVDNRGGRPGVLRVILRQVLAPVSSPFWLGYLIAWVTPRAAALHDILSGTRVVYARQGNVCGGEPK